MTLLADKKRKKRYLKELLLLVGAFLGLLLIRSEILDIRYVRSDSMDPTVAKGEWILVNKVFGRFGEPQMFDLVLFRNPEDGSVYFKRVAGMPGMRVKVFDGELFLDGRMYRKSMAKFRSLARTLFDSAEDPLEDSWDYSPDRVAKGTDGDMAFRVGPKGHLGAVHLKEEGAPESGDRGLRILFRTPEEGFLYAILGEDGDRFQFELQFDRDKVTGRIIHSKSGQGQEILAERKDPAWIPGSMQEIEVANLDNRLHFYRNGRPWIDSQDYQANTPYRRLDSGPTSLPAPVTLGVQEGEIRIAHFTLLEDLSYTDVGSFGVGTPETLGQKEYFLLGDNSARSEDSRFFGGVQRDSIIGRPVAVAFPVGAWRGL